MRSLNRSARCCLIAMVGLVLLLARVAEARGPGSSGLRIQANPDRLTLGANPWADLRIEADPAVRDLRLLVTVGRVEGLAPVQPGVFRATYLPPEQRYPQIAILLAVAKSPAGPVYGWTVLPLDGQGLAEVRSRPRATVTLKIGVRTFGPVSADASGIGRVPVVVPPGVQRGYFGGEVVDLGLPPIPRVQAIAERDVVSADRPEEVGVWIFAMDATGRPQPGDQMNVSVTRGSIEPLEPVEHGVLFTRWTLPPGEPASVRLEGRVKGDPLQKFRVPLRVQTGPASDFEAHRSRERVEAPVRGWLSVTAKAGMVSNFGNLLLPAGGAELGLWPDVPVRDLGLALEVSYLSFSRGATAEVSDFSGRNQLVQLFASLAFRVRPWERGEAWLSAGPGLTLVRARSRFGGGPQIREETAALAAQVALGVGHRLGPGLPFIEGRFVWSADPGLATLRGALRGAGLYVGYRFELD